MSSADELGYEGYLDRICRWRTGARLVLPPHGFEQLSVTRLEVLAAVGAYGRQTITEIAATLHLSHGTVSAAVATLHRRRYTRPRLSRDRRRHLVEITGAGRRLMRRLYLFHDDPFLATLPDRRRP